MVELTARDSTSLGTARLGRPASRIAEELGSLADLVGTWFGTHGWEMVAVPRGEKAFLLIVRPTPRSSRSPRSAPPSPTAAPSSKKDPSGKVIGTEQVQQLQYSQQSNLEFFARPDGDGLIMWPHVNVNTLRKQ